ncbi:hypothetical protein JP0043_09670 [Helicobacter pylori]|nr:hypothetical protein JP0043_09670 [Helicobacter pylori]
MKSPFDFVRLYGHYWGGHKTNLCALPIYTEVEEVEALIENHEVTPPPQPPQDTQQDLIIETQQKEPSDPCKIAPQKSLLIKWFLKKLKENSTTSLEIF